MKRADGERTSGGPARAGLPWDRSLLAVDVLGFRFLRVPPSTKNNQLRTGADKGNPTV